MLQIAQKMTEKRTSTGLSMWTNLLVKVSDISRSPGALSCPVEIDLCQSLLCDFVKFIVFTINIWNFGLILQNYIANLDLFFLFFLLVYLNRSQVTDDVSTDVVMTTIPTTPVKETRSNQCISDPAPRHVSDSELQVLQECLHRWRNEVEQDVRGKNSSSCLNLL